MGEVLLGERVEGGFRQESGLGGFDSDSRSVLVALREIFVAEQETPQVARIDALMALPGDDPEVERWLQRWPG